MKIELTETEYSMYIELVPETVEDFAKLARFAKNGKQEKPTVYMNIGVNPYLYIDMKKVDKSKQVNSISAKDR